MRSFALNWRKVLRFLCCFLVRRYAVHGGLENWEICDIERLVSPLKREGKTWSTWIWRQIRRTWKNSTSRLARRMRSSEPSCQYFSAVFWYVLGLGRLSHSLIDLNPFSHSFHVCTWWPLVTWFHQQFRMWPSFLLTKMWSTRTSWRSWIPFWPPARQFHQRKTIKLLHQRISCAVAQVVGLLQKDEKEAACNEVRHSCCIFLWCHD